MNGVQHLPVHMRSPRAWRNGGGVTRDIASSPDGVDDEKFLWRASIATITQQGPFSPWQGVDRALLLLRGTLMFAINGGDGQRLAPCDPSQLFAGEDEVSACPLGGPCTVLNIMTRRGHIQTQVESWITARPSDATQLLVVARQPTIVWHRGKSNYLVEDDALLLPATPATELEFEQPLIVAEFFT